MEYTNAYRLPLPMLKALKASTHEVPDGAFSATELLDPPRIVQLKRRNAAKIQYDVMDHAFILLGNAVHDLMERHGGGAVENLLTVELNGETISGKPDQIKDGVITDYKVTSVWSVIHGKPEWEQQVNIYRYLARVNGILVTEGRVTAIFRDWAERYTTRADYPQYPIMVLTIPLWPIRETVEFISERLALHASAREMTSMELPYCTKEERWLRGEEWAVYKKKTHKRAYRCVDTEEEAKEIVNGLDEPEKAKIEYRSGKSIRCQKYCNAAPFCNQWLELQKEELQG